MGGRKENRGGKQVLVEVLCDYSPLSERMMMLYVGAIKFEVLWFVEVLVGVGELKFVRVYKGAEEVGSG